MRVGVRIMPKKEVLDSQGRAVMETLSRHNFSLQDCRVGKYIELDVPTEKESQALEEGKKMAESLLVNPLIESYELEIL